MKLISSLLVLLVVMSYAQEHIIRTLWTYQTNECIRSSPALDLRMLNSTLYITSFFRKNNCDSGCLYAFTLDGRLKWCFKTGAWIWSSPAVGDDGTIYFGCFDSCLYAVKPDGTLKWSFKTNGPIRTGCPAIGSDGTIYIGSDDHYLYAVNPDGTLRWRYRTWNEVGAPPSIGPNGTIYFPGVDEQFYALNPDGKEKWKIEYGGNGTSSPAILCTPTDTLLYVGADEGWLSCIKDSCGQGVKKWRYYIPNDWVSSSPVIGLDTTVYVGSWENPNHPVYRVDSIYAFTPDSGRLKWGWGVPAPNPLDTFYLVGYGLLVDSDSTLYAGYVGIGLFALKPDGSPRWVYKPFPPPDGVWGSATIDFSGRIYFASAWHGVVHCLQGRGRLANTPWPKFRHDLRNTGRFGAPSFWPGYPNIDQVTAPNQGRLLTIDPQSRNLHMVYKSDSLLFYARSTNQGITWEPIIEVDSGSYPSLCLDNSGMPRISYLKNDTVFCKTLKSDNTWHKTILFGGNGNLKPTQAVIAQTYPKDLAW